MSIQYNTLQCIDISFMSKEYKILYLLYEILKQAIAITPKIN